MKILRLISILALCTQAFGTVTYVAQTAGSMTCNGGTHTAVTVATANGLTPSPGDTFYSCGTITASAGATNFITVLDGASGTSGNPITWIFDTGSIITATYWSGPVFNLGSSSYITINGGTNGTIQATTNGTGLANQQDNAVGVYSAGGSHVIVENLTVSNLYVHTCTGAIGTCTDEGGQNVYGMQFRPGTNISVFQNIVHDTKWGIFFAYGNSASTSSGILTYNNNIYNIDHGVVYGDQGTNSILSSSSCSSAIYNNSFGAMQNWDDAADDNHHDSIHIWANNAPGSNYTGVCVYSNLFSGNMGIGPSGIITMESLGTNDYVFNNIIDLTSGGDCADGALAKFTGSGTNGSGNSWFNNTVIPGSACIISLGVQENTGGVVENNLFMSNSGTFVYQASPNTAITTADYNTYGTPAGSSPFYGSCGSAVSFATWNSSCGFDTHGQLTAITLNGNYTLQSGSAAIGAAKNLTSLSITALDTGAPQTFGVTGTCGTGCAARPSSGAWDAGAYPYVSATQASPATCSPTSGVVPQTVTCTNPNTGTTVACYTTNGSTPATNGDGATCANGTIYSSSILVSVPITLKIVAGTNLLTDSSVNSYNYTASGTVATPTFAPSSGAPPQTVTISCSTAGATICYTNDGTTPVGNGAGSCSHGFTYSSPVSVTINPTTLRAIGTESGFSDSAVGLASYSSPNTAPTAAWFSELLWP